MSNAAAKDRVPKDYQSSADTAALKRYNVAIRRIAYVAGRLAGLREAETAAINLLKGQPLGDAYEKGQEIGILRAAEAIVVLIDEHLSA